MSDHHSARGVKSSSRPGLRGALRDSMPTLRRKAGLSAPLAAIALATAARLARADSPPAGGTVETLPKPASAQTAASDSATPATKDLLDAPGYIPGYRRDRTLGMSPYAPQVAGLPGGMTPSYGAPNPPSEWTFRWTGFLTTSLQFSKNDRRQPVDGQKTADFHVPPQAVDEYASFVGTSTVPGNWVQMSFVYGNRWVSANFSLTTWNPSDPTTFYQIGSEQFVNNAFLSFIFPTAGDLKVRSNVGYFLNAYGGIGQYGLGMYTNAMVGGVRGVGEDLMAEYSLDDNLTLTFEHGIMGSRNGTGPFTVNAASTSTPISNTGQNGNSTGSLPAAWIHHAHIGIESRGDITLRARVHYIGIWTQDDRTQQQFDDPTTRQLDESYVRDGRIDTFGFDAGLLSTVWGYLGIGGSYIKGNNAYALRGVTTFGGDGESLTNRWWGQQTGGTGKLMAAGINYSASLGRIVSYPIPFNSNGPDLTLNTGFIVAKTSTDFGPFDDRVRHKYGADLLYTFLPYMAVGFRADRVVPNSKDSEETFHVISPRLVFKSDWNSRDTITLLYAKWFYGPHSHSEGSSVQPGDRLDDQLFALNVQMWW